MTTKKVPGQPVSISETLNQYTQKQRKGKKQIFMLGGRHHSVPHLEEEDQEFRIDLAGSFPSTRGKKMAKLKHAVAMKNYILSHGEARTHPRLVSVGSRAA